MRLGQLETHHPRNAIQKRLTVQSRARMAVCLDLRVQPAGSQKVRQRRNARQVRLRTLGHHQRPGQRQGKVLEGACERAPPLLSPTRTCRFSSRNSGSHSRTAEAMPQQQQSSWVNLYFRGLIDSREGGARPGAASCGGWNRIGLAVKAS